MKATIANYLARNGSLVDIGFGYKIEVQLDRQGKAEFRFNRLRKRSEVLGHATFENGALTVDVSNADQGHDMPTREKIIALTLQKMMILGD